ncbi:hypothetical protein ABIB75_001089 [Bradyrhizobium sp. GM2.2]|uniref:hypothetical protein n=1 Tax=Bradyrhizobium sp. GM2.2 TaxID=3156358 RepID=UPI0033946391
MASIIAAAVLVVLGVLVGETAQRVYRRRLAEAGRSRMPPPERKVSIRMGS